MQGYCRRREAGFRSREKRLPRTRSIRSIRSVTEIGNTEANPHSNSNRRFGSGQPLVVIEEQHQISFRYGFYWLAAFWRKYSIKHSAIAEWFALGDLGQLLLIAVYLLLNFLLIFLGTAGDIDWMAHHVRNFAYD
jgi:hypothetical protein